ncbi:MAG: NAD-dependent epimerase/dehydratase family protein [Actinobacteria bacterium]|nr:NAD-dependent epimerase/dehydratase family protein [Actinomycetota bacterium]
MAPPRTTSKNLTVAVTGPTGDIGKAFVRALEKEKDVKRVIGMARRPFVPANEGLVKTEYLQGDVLDRAAVEHLVAEADVVVHLAFLIIGSAQQSRLTNLEGSRNVFEATAASAKAKRLIYTSSVAAYGFHDDNPDLLTEEVPTRGSEEHPYSHQKAEVEELLGNLTGHTDLDVYVFRPCIVAGPTALSLIQEIPYVRLGERLPDTIRKIVGALPLLRPVIPDPGLVFQLVHEDDVASALVAGVIGKGYGGAYNLAGEGDITMSDLANALGWYSVPVPDLAVDATVAVISKLPLMPARASWATALRVPVLMDTSKARAELQWEPRHDALGTLATTVQAARETGLLGP